MPTDRGSLSAPLVVAGPALAVLAWWCLDDGGYFLVDWLPGIVIVLGLLLVAACGLGSRLRPASQAATVAVCMLGGYAMWSFASIAWADAPAAALEGAQRALLYFGWFALFACLPWTIPSARVFVVATVLMIDVVGVVTLARVGAADDPLKLFVDARLAAPLGYQNAGPALWTMGALPGILLASRRETAPWLRPVLLALGGLVLALALLSDSRGWLFTLPMIAIVMLVMSPDRVRLAVFAAPVVVAVALAFGTIADVFSVAGGLLPDQAVRVAGPPIDRAVEVIVRMTLALAVAGVGLTAIDRLVLPRIAADVWRAGSRAIAALAIAALVAAAAWASTLDLPTRVDRAWSQFQHTEYNDADGVAPDQRLTYVEGARYDYWRVALSLWRAHPIAGAGQDNFAQFYLLRRRTTNEPRWVHSLPLRLLVHTGLVGAALFAAFLAALVVCVAGAWRTRRSTGGRAVVTAASLPLVVWLVHGSVDWLWEFPLLSCLALSGGAIAATAGPRGRVVAPRLKRRGRARATAVALSAVGAIAVLLVTVPSYVAERDVLDAMAAWPSDPKAALQRLERARALDPLGSDPWLVEGLIAAHMGRTSQARRAFSTASRRDPHNWIVQFELGLIPDRGRSVAEAERRLRAARRLSPKEPLVNEALRRVRGDHPMTLAEANLRFAERTRRREGR